MKFVVAAAFQPLDHLIPLAQVAEAAGFEALTFSDHVVYPETLDTPYPYTEDGSRRYDETSVFPDPWVVIGALAAVTPRLRFTNNVFVLAMRNPFLAAKAKYGVTVGVERAASAAASATSKRSESPVMRAILAIATDVVPAALPRCDQARRLISMSFSR